MFIIFYVGNPKQGAVWPLSNIYIFDKGTNSLYVEIFGIYPRMRIKPLRTTEMNLPKDVREIQESSSKMTLKAVQCNGVSARSQAHPTTRARLCHKIDLFSSSRPRISPWMFQALNSPRQRGDFVKGVLQVRARHQVVGFWHRH